MLADAARVAGVDFTEEERREMVATVNKNLRNYETTRAVALPFTVVPPYYFNPVVPGTAAVSARKSFRPSPAPRVSRPGNLEEVAFWPVTHLGALIESRQVSSRELTAYGEAPLLALAKAYQDATGHHHRHPDLD